MQVVVPAVRTRGMRQRLEPGVVEGFAYGEGGQSQASAAYAMPTRNGSGRRPYAAAAYPVASAVAATAS